MEGGFYLNKTLKNYEIINAIETIKQFLNLKDISTKLDYALNKNLLHLELPYKAYINSEVDLINKFALKDDQGKFITDQNNKPKFTPNNNHKLRFEQDELLNIENCVDIYSIKLSLFPDKLVNDKGEKITLHNIMFLIDECE
jgi:hypothetical protein